MTVTERFVTALVVGPQDYRHLFADTSQNSALQTLS